MPPITTEHTDLPVSGDGSAGLRTALLGRHLGLPPGREPGLELWQ